jgi:hypothetical protein
MRNHKSGGSTENHQIECLTNDLEGQVHQEKTNKVLMCDSHNESRKETPPKPSNEKPPKRLQKSSKKGNGIQKQITKEHKDELQTFHTLRGMILYKQASYLPSSYRLEDLLRSTS